MFFFNKKGEIKIPKNIYDEMLAHAKDEYPNECCGVLVGNPDGKIVFESHRVRNINTERTVDRYDIDPREVNLIDRGARSQSLDIIGFYHSHPDHPDRPSQYDRDMGQPEYSYVIISINKGVDISVKSWSFQKENEPFKEEILKVK
ncbi:MAG: M67 family metallopeptidase [Deltaproteobacteria bacterium]|nr:M67 family metallopeptidase [Deltaproteobacteria bacterium]